MHDRATFVHDVYFTLEDDSPAARQRLIAACYDKLAGAPGVVFLAAGTRDPELTRDVNDRDYGVSLHVLFADRDAHDAYQNCDAHVEFIEQQSGNWRRVRVFDSHLVPALRS